MISIEKTVCYTHRSQEGLAIPQRATRRNTRVGQKIEEGGGLW